MLRITLFGGSGPALDGRPVAQTTRLGTKPRQLFEILALHAGHAVPKQVLADLLWEGHPTASSAAGLESYVSVLRHQLGLGSGRTSVLATVADGYVLDTSRCTVDLLDLRGLADRAARAPFTEVVALAEQALEIGAGGLLAQEVYPSWAVEARRELDRVMTSLLTRGAQCALALGEPERAIPLGTAAVESDPQHEEAWRHLMRSHWFCGDANAALRAYGELRSRLLDELGQEPGEETVRLYLAVLSTTTQSAADGGHQMEVRLLLTLLRQALEALPGAHPPALDDDLSLVATRHLAGCRPALVPAS